MRVMGVDPGAAASGYGIVDEEGNSIFYVDCGSISTSSRQSFPQRLKKIYDTLEGVIARYNPDVVSVESLFYAKNVQVALKLGHGRGVALLAAVNRGIPVSEYSPLEIKKAVVGYGAAGKEQVGRMVKTLLKLDAPPKSDHASDALAAAICHIHSSRMDEVMHAGPGGRRTRRRQT